LPKADSKVRLPALALQGLFCYVTDMEIEKSIVQLTDFDFRPHRSGFQAVGLFENNFGCSVIPEADGVTYEVAILEHEGGKRCHVCYTSGLNRDVFRYLSVDSVHDVIAVTRNLKVGTRVLDYVEPAIQEF